MVMVLFVVGPACMAFIEFFPVCLCGNGHAEFGNSFCCAVIMLVVFEYPAHHNTARNPQDDVLPVPPVLALAATVGSRIGGNMGPGPPEALLLGIGNDQDRSTVPAVPTVRSPLALSAYVEHRSRSVPTGTPGYLDARSVDESVGLPSPSSFFLCAVFLIDLVFPQCSRGRQRRIRGIGAVAQCTVVLAVAGGGVRDKPIAACNHREQIAREGRIAPMEKRRYSWNKTRHDFACSSKLIVLHTSMLGVMAVVDNDEKMSISVLGKQTQHFQF